MRVAFYDPNQDTLTPQRKGDLFERLTRRLAEASGYTRVELRRKHNSLEYDIAGEHRLHPSRTLLGEAKAHEDRINGKELAAFVGKFLTKAIVHGTEGLFISTSSFTAEAGDYLRGEREAWEALPSAVHFRTLVGDEISRYLVDNAGYASEESLRSRLASVHRLEMIDACLVVTPEADFYACPCGPDRVSAPTAIGLFKTDGSELQLGSDLIERLQAQVPDLDNLKVLDDGGNTLLSTRRERLPGVSQGAGWFDYRFPTPPDCFIGRIEALTDVRGRLEAVRVNDTALRAVQVLSRSGVGKSSLLVKLGDEVGRDIALTVDGRTLRGPLDTRLLVSQAVEEVNTRLSTSHEIPTSVSAIDTALRNVGADLEARGLVLLVQVDQFESALTLPGVFSAVLALVETCTSLSLPILWVFARKNDLAATYDASADVDLRRLNEISHPVALKDFSPAEGRVLLDRLEERLEQTLQAGLSEAISEFSSGFPWLHKRLCAHVISAVKDDGTSQRDLVTTGLRPEDLFEEDLAGLDEQDKALLRRVAAHLPATGGELSQYLEAEISAERLTEKLNRFLSVKLLRRSGDIYDTYNDLFKTYLISERVPFESRFLFRGQPRAAIKLLQVIQTLGPTDLTRFQDHVGGSRIGVLNKLRELRLLGLIEPRPGLVALSAEAREALQRNELDELLRKRLRANVLVLRVLDLLATRDDVALSAVVEVLKRELPHVTANPETWRQYARTLASWLHSAGLARLEGEALYRQDSLSSVDVFEGRAFSLGSFGAESFVPTVRPEKIARLCELLRSGPLTPKELEAEFDADLVRGLLRDAANLDIAVQTDGRVELGRQGRAVTTGRATVSKAEIARLSISKPNVRALLDAATPGPIDGNEQRRVMEQFGSAGWSDGTWEWRMGILRSWLYGTGQVKNLRGKGLVAC